MIMTNYSLSNKYKENLIYVINCLYGLLMHCKYFIYLQIFLLILLFNSIYITISGNINNCIIQLLYFSINLNGSVLIKIIQWYIPLLQINNDNESAIEIVLKKYYENCNIHSLKYTKQIFKNEYKYDFDDIFIIDNEFIIKSGSIAQVYKCYYKENNNEPIIIKVIHPETNWQKFWIENIFIFWLYISKKINYLNKYSLPINGREYINNFNKQFNMNNEYNNLLIYYNYYKNNEFIVIPKPIFSSTNLLIMSYEEGINFEDLKESEYIRSKIFILFSLFIKNNNFELSKLHLDLHEGNWRVKKYNNFYKIIIYDFGYCCDNFSINIFKELDYCIDKKLIYGLFNICYNYVNRINISLVEFSDNGYNFYTNKCKETNMDNNYKNLIISSRFIIQFLNCNKFEVNYSIFELLINTNIVSKNINKYCTNNLDTNIIYVYISICKTLNIFPNIIDHYDKYYINKINSNFNNYYLKNINVISINVIPNNEDNINNIILI